MYSTTRQDFIGVTRAHRSIVPPPPIARRWSRNHWLVRFMVALRQSRRRAAQREFARYAHLIDLERRHADLVPRKSDLPFGGR
jgi:hypothetical protein